MGRPGYALARVICVRAAGVPFDHLDALGARAVAAAARHVLDRERAVDEAAEAVIAHARATFKTDDRAERAALKRLVRGRRPIGDELRARYPWLEPYALAAEGHARALSELDEALERESLRVHHAVRRNALAVLPDFAAIESEAMLTELDAIAAAEPSAPRASDRETDRSLAMYLQRVCSKGDTISRFGPSGWATVVAGDGLQIDPVPGIAARRIEVERWVVASVIAMMNADPEVRAEVCPRAHPDVVLDELPADARTLATRCDGVTPAHELGDPAALARLADAGTVIWEQEKYAVDVSPLGSLVADVTRWRPSAVRSRWLERLESLRDHAAQLGTSETTAQRREVIAGFRSALAKLGIAGRDRGRTLYAAANPISENCFREYHFELGAGAVDRLISDAAPWFDLFHDAHALAVGRAFERYRELVVAAPRRNGRLLYADLLAFGKARRVEIDNDHALLEAARDVFGDVGRALDGAFANRADAPEWEITAEDCHVLRRQYDLPELQEFAWPQADVQIAATSPADVAAGRYQWVVAELHHALSQLQHALYWSCPDQQALRDAMVASVEGRPFAVRGALGEQPVHNAGEFRAFPNATFVGRGRPRPEWTTVRRADAEVVMDEAARDIRLRDPAGRDLGSLIRCFRTMMGMHPFFPFVREPHAPRLRLGTTVVQRQTWNVTSAELGEPRPTGLSAAFVTAIERMRRDRGIPRWVFTRARSKSFTTSDLYARDKDLKPFYVDLESTVFLDILERKLRKYGEVVFSEMLPSPDQLVWSDRDGRTVFELRTSVIPAGPRSSAART